MAGISENSKSTFFKMSNQTTTTYTEKRGALIAKKNQLEKQITESTDPKAVALLRADFRNVIAELEGFYDDEPQATGLFGC
jgi:Fe-S-cluster formation regulator IscX/YfhJ